MQGAIRESRYRRFRNGSDELYCYQDVTLTGDVTCIDDTQGHHKVGNPGSHISATLHLYSPPVHLRWNNECEPTTGYVLQELFRERLQSVEAGEECVCVPVVDLVGTIPGRHRSPIVGFIPSRTEFWPYGDSIEPEVSVPRAATA